jgi:hypothetical protein
MYGDPPQDMTPTEYANKIQDNFTGEGNNAKLITQLVSNKESAPDYTKFSNEPDGIFMSLDTLTQQNILRAHKLHPTLLMSTAGSLGQSSEIKTLFDWFYATVIDGYQKMVLEFWDKVLEHAGFGQYRLEIANNNPILNLVKTYMFLKVRFLFDPPTTSYHLSAMKDQISEYEWRLREFREELTP